MSRINPRQLKPKDWTIEYRQFPDELKITDPCIFITRKNKQTAFAVPKELQFKGIVHLLKWVEQAINVLEDDLKNEKEK